MTDEREIPSISEVDFARVRRVSDAADLIDVRLASLSAQPYGELSELPADWGLSAFVGFDADLLGGSSADENFSVRVQFVALHFSGWDARTHDGPPDFELDRAPTLELSIAFDCVYALSDVEDRDAGAVVDSDDILHFAAVSGPMHAWPYWRELAQSITARMAIPPLRVAPFRLSKLGVSIDPDK
jgi:hypothetical protein